MPTYCNKLLKLNDIFYSHNGEREMERKKWKREKSNLYYFMM